MANNFNDIMNLYNRMKSDPMQILSMRFNIPNGVNMRDPSSIIQHLLNTGQVTQSQVNQVMQMQNNPVIQRILGGR